MTQITSPEKGELDDERRSEQEEEEVAGDIEDWKPLNDELPNLQVISTSNRETSFLFTLSTMGTMS